MDEAGYRFHTGRHANVGDTQSGRKRAKLQEQVGICKHYRQNQQGTTALLSSFIHVLHIKINIIKEHIIISKQKKNLQSTMAALTCFFFMNHGNITDDSYRANA